MSIQASVSAVYEDDPEVVDARVDLNFPQGNGGQWWSTSILVPRANLPAGYTQADIAAACTAVIDTAGITVAPMAEPEASQSSA